MHPFAAKEIKVTFTLSPTLRRLEDGIQVLPRYNKQLNQNTFHPSNGINFHYRNFSAR